MLAPDQTRQSAVFERLRQGILTGTLAAGSRLPPTRSLATELGVDLIIVGHQQKASIATRWWRGSVGKSLLDSAPCSVLIGLDKT